jgi:hypothetical protein
MSRTRRWLRPRDEGAHRSAAKEGDVKYMIMMFGDTNTMFEVRSPEWIRDMIAFMGKLDQELRDSGELVGGQGLVDPSEAKTVRLVDDAPVPTDGPFAEAKESLAGYWIIEGSKERAIEVAASCVAFTGEPVEVRQVADAPPEV